MLLQIRKLNKRKNRFSVNSQNLIYTIFCESTVYIDYYVVTSVTIYSVGLPVWDTDH